MMKMLNPIIQEQENPHNIKVRNLLKLINVWIHFTKIAELENGSQHTNRWNDATTDHPSERRYGLLATSQ